jgi:hypothetical protein
MPPVDTQSRTTRMLLFGAAVLALLGVVAFASRSGVTHTSSTAPETPGYVSWLMTVFLIIFVALTPYAVWVYLQQSHERHVAANRSFPQRVIRSLAILILVMGVVTLIAYARRHHIFFGSGQHTGGNSATPVAGQGAHGKHPATPQPHFEWPVLWVALGLVALVGGWWWLSLRRRGSLAALPWEGEEPELAADVALTIGDAIDDLEAEPDARRAVIAAYARMENTFARHGVGRRASETPLEYLRRALLALTAERGAVAQLTDLFEEAKFSRHDIGSDMKRDAIDALRTIRDDLQGVPA